MEDEVWRSAQGLESECLSNKAASIMSGDDEFGAAGSLTSEADGRLDVVFVSLDVLIPNATQLVLDAYNGALRDAAVDWQWSEGLFSRLLRSTIADTPPEAFVKRIQRYEVTDDVRHLARSLERRKNSLLSESLKKTEVSCCPSVLRLLAALAESSVTTLLVSHLSDTEMDSILRASLGTGYSRLLDGCLSLRGRTPAQARLEITAADFQSSPAQGLLICLEDDTLSKMDMSFIPALRITRSTRQMAAMIDYILMPRDLAPADESDDAQGMMLDVPGGPDGIIERLQSIHNDILNSRVIRIPVVSRLSDEERGVVMLVSSVLKNKGSTVISINAKQTIGELVMRLRENGIGALIVLNDDGELVGIISERDISFGLAEFGGSLTGKRVEDLMTKTVITCQPTDAISDLEKIMTQRRIRHIPVTVDGDVVGLVSIGDVLKCRLDEMALEANVLRDVAIASR